MDTFKICAASAGSKCWCGKDAVISRTGVGIESHYCSEHWQLWWEYALPQIPLLVIRESGKSA